MYNFSTLKLNKEKFMKKIIVLTLTSSNTTYNQPQAAYDSLWISC